MRSEYEPIIRDSGIASTMTKINMMYDEVPGALEYQFTEQAVETERE